MSQKPSAKAKAMAAAVGAQAAARSLGLLPNQQQTRKFIPSSKRKKQQGRNGNMLSSAIPSTRVGSFAPASIASQQRPYAPRIFNRTQSGGMRIVHKELVGSVSGTSAFTVQNALALNPGVAATFPWLSSQANYWEQYKFNRLRFEYVTRCASTQVGSVIMAPDYDAADSNPTSESNMSTYQDSAEDAPWKNIICDLNPKSMHPDGPKKFIRTGNVSGDVKTYDVGLLFLATTDCGGTPPLGKLWVEYDVELFVPQTSPSAIIPKITSFYRALNGQSFSTATQANVQYDNIVSDALRIGAVMPAVSFTLPIGAYLIYAQLVCRNTAAEHFTAILQVYKDGVYQNYGAVCEQGSATSGNPTQVLLSMTAIVTSTGANVLNLKITMTGATGTLTIPADTCTLFIQSA